MIDCVKIVYPQESKEIKLIRTKRAFENELFLFTHCVYFTQRELFHIYI